jgi:hypothetical protein
MIFSFDTWLLQEPKQGKVDELSHPFEPRSLYKETSIGPIIEPGTADTRQRAQSLDKPGIRRSGSVE